MLRGRQEARRQERRAPAEQVHDRMRQRLMPDLDVRGNIPGHEHTFSDGTTPVATVSKKWFRVADAYDVEIAPGHDPVLAATVAIDAMADEARLLRSARLCRYGVVDVSAIRPRGDVAPSKTL